MSLLSITEIWKVNSPGWQKGFKCKEDRKRGVLKIKPMKMLKDFERVLKGGNRV